MKRKLRYGMVGGGQNAFIGAVHRMAANLDGQIELVAGAFSSDAKNSQTTGEQLFLNPSRVYASYEEMAEREAALSQANGLISFPLSRRIFCTRPSPRHF
jgi:predicted dehydrogenase